jgi:hypothetical protein
MDQLPFYSEDELPQAPERNYIETIVNSQPMENTPFIAPFVPVNINVALKAIGLAQLQPDDVLVDLGCGDGRILAEARRLHNISVIGIEYDELLVNHVKKVYPWMDIRHQDMFLVDLDEMQATVLILYLLPAGLDKLKMMLEPWLMKGRNRCITIGYSIPGLECTKEIQVPSDGSFMGGKCECTQPIYFYSPGSIIPS